jgi:ATP-binding cassette subfamily B protein
MDTLMLQASNIFVSIIASLIIIAIIAPILLIPTLLLTAVILIESVLALKKRSMYRNQRKELQSRLFGTFADIVGNQMLVRMFGRAKDEIRNTVREREAIEKIAAKEIDIIQFSAERRMAILIGFQIVTMLVAVYLTANSLVSIAALVFTVTYLSRVAGIMYNINSIIRTSEQAFLDAAKITEILQRSPEIKDAPNATVLKVKQAAIDLSNVSFHYSDTKSQVVFDNLSFHIPARKSIGLVGKSGSGKSTLVQLLLRYMDVNQGSITIDGQDIATVTQDSLRDAISYVPQEPYLFHRSLRENIAYGKPAANDNEIMAAAKKAYAWEFIETLPNGLDTIVGERGVKLSGGQRQRVAIARAILKDAPILILDEATSALDSESEVYIQKALSHLMTDRTSIVIAHRLSTIARLDRIVVLSDGQIVEDGPHHELLERKGTYARLWAHQSGGFIEG